MAQFPYRANLSADDIPLLSQLQGQTVIVGKFDQDYTLDSNLNNTQKLQKEKNIPDAYYGHNIVPTGQGYQTVGYVEKVAAMPGVNNFDKVYTLRDPDENKTFYVPANGRNYIFDRNLVSWRSINPIIGHEGALVTIAYLNGETYIFYKKVGCFKYDKVTSTIIPVVLVGLVVANINGICSSNGFLLAWDDDNVIYRSQSVSPLDFTPDPSLGSGAGIPEDIRGKIVVLLPISNGFIVYTTANAVGATFQQNIRYPFIFKEVEGSSGIGAVDHVGYQDNLGEHYVWSKSGLLRVNKSKAIAVFPKITDFLVAKIFEDFDSTTNLFTVNFLATQLNVKMTCVGSRFVVISYGILPGIFTHAIIYDLAHKRFGKLKITHVDCFNFTIPNLSGDISWTMLGDLSWEDLGDTSWADLGIQIQTVETPKEILGFMSSSGQIRIVDFDLIRLTGDDGVLILGKYKFSRSNLLVMDEIAVENMNAGSDFKLALFTSLDGKNTDRITLPYNDINRGLYRHYFTDQVGENHSLGLKGTFHVISLQMVMHPHGRA